MDFNTILSPLQHSLIAWIAQYPLTTHPLSLTDLTNAQFFSYMLPRVDGFIWSQAIQWAEFTGLATGQKVKRMRIVGRSITRFYYSQLQLSLDNLAFNYIEMCMPQGEAEVLRLFIAVIGVMMRSKEIRDELQLFLDGLDAEQAGLLRIMIDYAYKIGDKMGESAESPGKRQKKLVSKLQSLQEQLQFYQGYTQQLEIKVETLTQEVIRHKRNTEELQVGGNKLVKRIQYFQLTNEELCKQLDTKTKLQETLTQRLAVNRQAAQEMVDRLLLQNQKQRQESDHYRKQLSSQLNLQKQNKILKTLLHQKQQIVQDLKFKMAKQSQSLALLQAQNKQLNKKLNSITTQNQGLQIKLQLFERSYPINRTFTFSPQQQSIVFPTRLGDSYLQDTPKQWFTVDQQNKQIKEDNLSESLTFSIRSGQSNFFPPQKGFLSIKDLQQSYNNLNQNKQNNDPNSIHCIKLSEVEQQKSMQMTTSQFQGTKNFKAQLQLATCTIFDLQTNLQLVRKELRAYQAKQTAQARRSAHFANKVQKMFA